MRPLVLAIMVILTSQIPTLAKTPPKRFAAIAVVEATGEVLHARHANKPRHPASLTKVMTLYMVFDAIKAGELGWDDPLRVSAKAARARPSKLGLQANATISVEDAVRAMVTKSANDVAIVLAERLGGGEARFATMMTKKAHALGMTDSHFVNASGLPDKRQVMTARDMAVLAYRIHHDFPADYRYFSLSKLVWNQRSLPNHNTLLGRVKGVDGLKTGFTNQSGYNIAVTAERDGERLIVVVFGGSTAAERDAYATKLLERAFDVLAQRRANKAQTPAPPLKDLDDREPVLVAGLPGLAHQGDGERRGVQIVIDDTIESRPLPLIKTASTPQRNLAAAPPAPAGQWGIQVGAYSSAAQASARLHHISDIAQNELAGHAGHIAEGERNGAPLYRVRFLGLSPVGARALCAKLNRLGQSCFAVPPG
ncbi:MAG: D-alanyl-D-alanine carboxypeptidase family protein [Robiginitomaculum sp.]|nr:D-alanyl-D-alanine carboxypeptidase family protein [Robiginitomaculum sp.]MDQ7077466.1 D-alanyl-D-alanine carboxypeptidase family protein [Robiginitomaculum sp.]